MRKTKIIATLGPATSSREAIAGLIDAGADAVRLNCSHGTLAEHEKLLRIVREVSKERGAFVAVLQDLPGPKMRVGKLPAPVILQAGQQVSLVVGDQAGPDTLPVEYPQIVGDVKVGGRILIDDGNIELKVRSKDEGRLVCEVIEGGVVSSRKGINLPGADISASALGERDRELLRWGIGQGVDYVALSFVRSPEEVRQAKDIISHEEGSARVIAKIEKPEALEVIDEIIDAADGVMVARGDLGVEMSPEVVPEVQKALIRKCNERDKTVITATQMLESMTHSMRPTRAEASDVANAIIDGTDCIMLSGETAVGEYPGRAVRMMDRIAVQAESYLLKQAGLELHTRLSKDAPVGDAVCHGVYQVACDINVALIGIFTITGSTALLMSKYRTAAPIAGLSPHTESLRRMALYYGVYPVQTENRKYFEEMVAGAEEAVKKRGLAAEGDRVVFTAGIPIGTSGTTNSLQIRELGR
jgi:pyruvate kinase